MLALGLFVRSSSRRFKGGLAIACLAPSVLLLSCFAYQERQLKAAAILMYFREFLANPIPASAKAIHYESTNDWGGAGPIIWFEIAKPDLDHIIADRGYVLVAPGHFPTPIVSFNDPNYLRIGSDDLFYQLNDGRGSLYTLRVNNLHTIAVLRCDNLQNRTQLSSPNPLPAK